MKTKILVLLLISITTSGGCKKKVTEIPPESKYICFMTDSNTAKAYIMAMLPQINTMYNQTKELSAQNHWLMQNLDKCLKQLEIEKGLKPILPKQSFMNFKGEPNLISKNSNESQQEPWFVPYEGFAKEDLEQIHDIAILRSMIVWHPGEINNVLNYINNRIENFEERLKRLDANQPLQKPSE